MVFTVDGYHKEEFGIAVEVIHIRILLINDGSSWCTLVGLSTLCSLDSGIIMAAKNSLVFCSEDFRSIECAAIETR